MVLANTVDLSLQRTIKGNLKIKQSDPVQQTSDDEDDYLFVAARNKTHEILDAGRSEQDTLASISELLSFATLLVENFERKTALSVACKAGCHYCCFAQVAITPPEALLIGHMVKCAYSARDQLNLMHHIDHNLKLTHGRTLQERIDVWQNTPCIFLKSRECSIYTARPLICRAWHSLDAAQCKTAFCSKDSLSEMDSYPHRNYILGTIRDGLQQGCWDLGCQSQPVEMAKAMEAYFNHQTPWQNWLSGENVF